MAAMDPMSNTHNSHPGDPGDEGNLLSSLEHMDWLQSIFQSNNIDFFAAGLDLTDIASASVQTNIDAEFLNELDQPLELSNLELEMMAEDPVAILSTENLLRQVDGGAWFPTNPESGVTPRIEAFAKLEFQYGQDFYLSSINIVLGRQDKEPSFTNGKRKKRRFSSSIADSLLNLDEVKVPLFPPPDVDISSISRKHLRIQYDYELSAWRLTSLCDTGFKLVRGGKVRFFPNGKKIKLENSDLIQFGNLAFTWFLPDQDEPEQKQVEEAESEDRLSMGEAIRSDSKTREVSSDLDSDHESDDGDDEDEDSELDSREPSHDVGTPGPRSGKHDGLDDSSLMPPPPVKRGRGRPPKNGISVREQKLLKRQAQEEFLASGGNVANLDMTKYGNLPVDKLFAKEGERMQLQIEKEARRKQKMEEKEAKIREKQAAKDLKPSKPPKERKRKRTKSPPAREEDYTPEQLAKPSLPYTVMIFDAIHNSEKKALTLPEIYRSLETAYPYFKVRAETTGWQSSVRHNLRGSGEGGGSSLFERGERSGKGYIWKIAEGANIDKERKKRKPVTTGSPHPATVSMQPGQMTVPSGGTWGQTAAQAGQFNQTAQFAAHQYQPRQASAVQHHSQNTYQAAVPAPPPAPMPATPVPNGVPSHPRTDTQPPVQQQKMALANAPPPPTWNPSQPKSQPAPVAPVQTSHATAPTMQQPRPPAVAPQPKQPIRQHQVAAPIPQQPRPAAHITASSAPIPGSTVAATRPPSGAMTTPGKGSVSSEVDSKARDLLDNPTFLKIMKEHLQKYPGHNINSPEVRKALWAEFKKTTSSKAAVSKGSVPKAPIPKAAIPVQKAVPENAPQRPAQVTTHSVPQSTLPIASTPALAKAAPIPVAKPSPSIQSQPSTPLRAPQAPHQGQNKPPAPASLPNTKTAQQPNALAAQRAGALLKGLQMDAKKRAEILQVLKNAKEKKAAEAMGGTKAAPVVGTKRSADGAPDSTPVAKRTAIEGQQ
ncbi:hypothetical protein ABW20_dc0100518 [Dactylellina cionopaga]|nr:hypothetical protein ABW20_dc0100518 [Dactylellina cionopaga]